MTVPRVGHDQAVEQPGERRLARAVGADDPDPLLAQLQVDVAEHLPPGRAVAVDVADPVELITGTLHHHRHTLAAAHRDGREPEPARPAGATSWLNSRTTSTAPEAPHG